MKKTQEGLFIQIRFDRTAYPPRSTEVVTAVQVAMEVRLVLEDMVRFTTF